MSDISTSLTEIISRKDIDTDKLEKFLDLQFRFEDKQNEKAFNAAMTDFQGLCPIITRNKKVQFKQVDYAYAPLDEIIHVIKPHLVKTGLSYSFDVDMLEKSNAKLTTKISHVDGHSKEYSYFFNPMHDDARMNDSQRRKSALSYAKRAGLENALGIVTQGEDDDAIRTSAVTEDQANEIYQVLGEIDNGMDRLKRYVKNMHGIDIKSVEEISSKDAKAILSVLRGIAEKEADNE